MKHHTLMSQMHAECSGRSARGTTAPITDAISRNVGTEAQDEGCNMMCVVKSKNQHAQQSG